ncbi:transposase [Streptomyces sp. NPDC016566]|uniref:transposase n=1 Tax=Streptomyces sp. NPDC016566 TaxID=3364967 RepID=UPI00370277C1
MIDSQSVKADAVVGADSRGFDGGKLVNGRKRHVVVDTLGLLLGVMVTAADTGDRAAAQVLLHQVADAHHRLALVWADGGYTGSLVEHCLATLALVLAIVKRSDDMRGFVVLPKRWMRCRELGIQSCPMKSPQPTDPQAEAAQGRIAPWLDPEDLRWLAQHCRCAEDATDEDKDRCGRIRFRARTALHKHQHSA